MFRSIRSIPLALAALLAAIPAAADHFFSLQDNWSKDGYSVLYTNDNPYNCMPGTPAPGGADNNFLPDFQALNMLRAIAGPVSTGFSDPNGFLDGFSDLGFAAPDFDDEDPLVLVYDCAPGGVHDDDNCDNGSASEDLITMPATGYCASTEESIRLVIGHELFHHVQYAYIDFDNWVEWGRMAVEGSARMMEDQVFSDLDDGSGATNYISEVGNYLNNPGQTFWGSSYKSALGWKYAAEQFGNITTEPERGADFVRQFWANAAANQDNPNTPGTFRQTLQDFKPGTTLENWFQDFSIANILRSYDVSVLPDASRYQYFDENDGTNVTYANVSLNGIFLVPQGLSTGTVDMLHWASAYYIAVAGDCARGNIFGFRGIDQGPFLTLFDHGDPVRFAVFGIDDDATNPRVVNLLRGAGKDFGAAFVIGTTGYSQLGAVITTTSASRRVEYIFDCGPGALDIELPTAGYKAYVGPPGPDRQMLIVAVRVTGPNSLAAPTIKGLDIDDFTVYIGNNNDPNDQGVILASSEVGQTYWLTIYPPDKPNSSTYNLYVNLADTLTATELNSVSYEEHIVDEVITLDISGSMLGTTQPGGAVKIAAARSAASMLVDRAHLRGNMGVVVFDGDAMTVEPLVEVQAFRDVLKTAIRNINANPAGLTSIGDGLDRAGDELLGNGSPIQEDWVLLLSDGRETASLNWPDVRTSIKNAGIHVAAFALGVDADHRLMQEIADETNGFFFPIDTASTSSAKAIAPAAAVGSDPLPNLLADAYLLANESAERRERLWDDSGALDNAESVVHSLNIEEGGITEAVFAFHWNDPGDVLDVQITRPDHTIVQNGVGGVEVFSGDAHIVVHAGILSMGTWEIQLTAATGDVDYVGVLTGRDQQAANLRFYFGQTHDEQNALSEGIPYLWGLPQPIVATLVDKTGPITGAAVTALVLHPDGATNELPLLDDGLHGDGNPNDGAYANEYTRTTSTNFFPQANGEGSYQIRVVANGSNNLAQAFVRIRKRGFSVSELNDPVADTDEDGMPDRYELPKPCLDPFADETAEDFDLDGLSTAAEWRLGTDPCHPDTDHGGESDGSEALRGANPFDADDDMLELPIDPEVIDWVDEHLPFPPGIALLPETNLIRYPMSPTYTRMRLWRAASSFGPWSVVTVLSGLEMTGLYADTGLENNKTYYYMVQPLDLNGNAGAHSRVFSGTPKAEPVPPIGSVIINNGAELASSTSVTLSLVASVDVTEMKIATNPADFPLLNWQPYSVIVNTVVVPDPVTDIATVYVRFRDADKNESPSDYSDSIQVVLPRVVGAILGEISLMSSADPSGVAVYLAEAATVPPFFLSREGRLKMRDLPPGNYTLVISRDGYEDIMLDNVRVLAGRFSDIGKQIMVPLDSDGDGVSDLEDNCTLATNPDQQDTNGDGFGNHCDPDLNNDLRVDFADLAILKSMFFTVGQNKDADLNVDGRVDFADLAILKSRFFSPPGPSGLAP